MPLILMRGPNRFPKYAAHRSHNDLFGMAGEAKAQIGGDAAQVPRQFIREIDCDLGGWSTCNFGRGCVVGGVVLLG
jgi:hypothetical protein